MVWDSLGESYYSSVRNQLKGGLGEFGCRTIKKKEFEPLFLYFLNVANLDFIIQPQSE